MNSKKIGNIGEAKFLSKCVEHGIPIYIPFGDNERADFVIEYNNKLLRIQVKTSVKAKDNKMIFDLTSSTCHRKNGNRHRYTNAEVDYFALYNIERDVLLLYKAPKDTRTSITIHYSLPLNNQVKNINFEDDYLFEKVLCVETLHGTSND